jgi:hypothetical protein
MFLDPLLNDSTRTGDFLVDPVHPSNAPSRTFVNRTSQTWCEQGPWPAGYSVSCNMAASQLKKALATWVRLPMKITVLTLNGVLDFWY